MPWPQRRRLIGTKVQRLDGPDKATGRAKYSFDINLQGLLHARMLRCPHAHARVKNIDTAAAEKVPGFRAFHIIKNAGAELFFAGDEVLAVCADTEEHAEDVRRAVRVDYEILPHRVTEANALANEKMPSTVSAPGNQVTVGGETTVGQDFATAAFQNTTGENSASPTAVAM